MAFRDRSLLLAADADRTEYGVAGGGRAAVSERDCSAEHAILRERERRLVERVDAIVAKRACAARLGQGSGFRHVQRDTTCEGSARSKGHVTEIDASVWVDAKRQIDGGGSVARSSDAAVQHRGRSGHETHGIV